MKIHCISLGCPKNLTDTEAVLGILRRAGHKIIPDAAKAEIILINTCAFIQSATEESIDTILDAAKYKKTGKCKHLIVMGCLPSRYQKKISKLLPEVDAFVGSGELDKINEIIGGAVAKEHAAVSPRKQKSCLFGHEIPRLKVTPKHFAYVKIADGCNNRCTYCTIPQIRGRYQSRPIDSIIKEVKLLAKMGAKEIIFVAQETTYYGTDLYGKPALVKLLKSTAKIKGIHWIRIMYTHPARITDELIKLIKNEPKICKYLDLPLQHICDKILTNMGRRYTRRLVDNLISKIRRSIPEIVLRSTFLVGFPGETNKDFEELLRFTENTKLERLGVFKYSKEEGTPASKLRGQVSAKVKNQRFHKLMRRQNMISRRFNRNLINKMFEILVDCGVSGGSLGRTYMDAPEIDGSVLIKNSKIRSGKIVLGKIIDSSAYDLSARLIT
ncbi:MAG: 30S ribosomal protein S12 methylthiotransferase RimO [Candidatus Margulisbacteria bacterium]|nr:30S ribosomal protein S12 methylthiotransferase RimO [Candidatus Margulisiibacteriota bacterium]MBU1021894.1 30S ribosomal protein S12 methylthiotransferase RimO [Candidatus Margulisiibacteriota bacterium]MBU1728532.1 30S ribosomal protein S12 methylthiotransferase RimO [Candidatus Margulisiibacteriota bacterium]MBU1954679.1 30S ribosomal protein S12 methylthiotransferase RimO [Candidatus Margulisiibacteriota bacterium]